MGVKLKIIRRFKAVKHTAGVDLIPRTKPLPAAKLVNVGPCAVCTRPLMVAVGQHIRFHRECREEGRKRFGRAERFVEVEEGGKINQSYVAKKPA